MTIKQILAGTVVGACIVSVMVIRLRKSQDATSLAHRLTLNHKVARNMQPAGKEGFFKKRRGPKDALNASHDQKQYG